MKDKLWFWGSYGKQDLRIQRLNQSRDKTVLEDHNAKLNFQVAQSNMLSAYWFLGEKIKLGRPNTRGLGTETPSHGRDQGWIYEDGSWPNGFLKVEDNHVFSPSFMLNVKASHYNTGFGLVPIGGLELSEGLDIVNSIAYGSSKQYQSVRPQDTLNADATYFRGPPYRLQDEAGQTARVVGTGGTGRIGGPEGKAGGRARAAINTVDRVTEGTLGLRLKGPEDASDLQGALAAGDTGAPAFFEVGGRFFVAGIASRTEDTNRDGIPGSVGDWEIYTRVSAYAAWIDAVAGDAMAAEAAAIVADPGRR